MTLVGPAGSDKAAATIPISLLLLQTGRSLLGHERRDNKIMQFVGSVTRERLLGGACLGRSRRAVHLQKNGTNYLTAFYGS